VKGREHSEPMQDKLQEASKDFFAASVETDPCVSHVAKIHSEGRESATLIMRGLDLSAEVVAMSQGENVLFLAR
jgi:hypothetical protein